MNDSWIHAQTAENKFWGQCIKTYGEETKQIELYAPRMGLISTYGNYIFDMNGKSVLDIGCGPVSLLLKCVNVEGTALDPLMDSYPQWVRSRYEAAGVRVFSEAAEDVFANRGKPEFDEVWIYNVLQHVQDPKQVLDNAKQFGKFLRIFEWIEVPADTLHLHVLHEHELNEWIGAEGMTEKIHDHESFSLAYYNKIKL